MEQVNQRAIDYLFRGPRMEQVNQRAIDYLLYLNQRAIRKNGVNQRAIDYLYLWNGTSKPKGHRLFIVIIEEWKSKPKGH